MRKLLAVILILVCSCKKPNAIKKPDNLIGKDKMVQVLYDLHMLSATKSSAKEVLSDNSIDADQYVFTKYSIDSIQLAKSMTYYASKPSEMAEMYNVINSRLEEQKKIFEKERDSISKKNKLKAKSIKLKDSLLEERKKEKMLTAEKPQQDSIE
ncbi:DUF4296 domain-containing protein [Spongiivirga sp. MCCC 1A20706]|uniref:DUF4296 domain-containing protein n=1 Tax=Spongiivirga sp. MCCC 1A20706 TaxID=3160963 RepID=UPI0039775B82